MVTHQLTNKKIEVKKVEVSGMAEEEKKKLLWEVFDLLLAQKKKSKPLCQQKKL